MARDSSNALVAESTSPASRCTSPTVRRLMARSRSAWGVSPSEARMLRRTPTASSTCSTAMAISPSACAASLDHMRASASGPLPFGLRLSSSMVFPASSTPFPALPRSKYPRIALPSVRISPSVPYSGFSSILRETRSTSAATKSSSRRMFESPLPVYPGERGASRMSRSKRPLGEILLGARSSTKERIDHRSGAASRARGLTFGGAARIRLPRRWRRAVSRCSLARNKKWSQAKLHGPCPSPR